ncbi:MAG: MCE family protein [Bryobacterales bacterium]|nr:MCE family protein [Bryobacterales bacterium]
MPSANKVAWAQLRVGIVAAVAMILLAALVLLITGRTSFFAPKANLYTFLKDSAALASGANVRINGILAGRVASVELTGSTQPDRVVKVTLEVERRLLPQIPSNSIAAMAAENLLGSKYINIQKGDSPVPVQPGAELKAKDTSEFDEVLRSSYNLLGGLRATLERIDRIVAVVESGEGSIGKLIFDTQLYNNLNRTAGEANRLMAQINSGQGTIGKLMYDDAIVTDVRNSIARFNVLLDDLQAGKGTAGKLLKDEKLYAELRSTMAEYRKIAADLNSGKGTAGKLLKDEDLHKQILATMNRVDTLFDKINSGQGTLGQLVVNPQMYESLNGASREIHEFLKAFRSNPKKYLSIKLNLF